MKSVKYLILALVPARPAIHGKAQKGRKKEYLLLAL